MTADVDVLEQGLRDALDVGAPVVAGGLAPGGPAAVGVVALGLPRVGEAQQGGRHGAVTGGRSRRWHEKPGELAGQGTVVSGKGAGRANTRCERGVRQTQN